MIILLKSLTLLIVTAYGLLIGQKIYKISQHTDDSKFKVGDRVALMTMWMNSQANTGGHMPFHGEVLAVRRHKNFKFEYDVLPDYSETGDYERNVLEHDISHQHESDTPPTVTLTSSVELLSRLK